MCSRCTDPRETLEMKAAACLNAKCNEFVDIESKTCQRCGATLNKTHCSNYHSVMKLTEKILDFSVKRGNFLFLVFLKPSANHICDRLRLFKNANRKTERSFAPSQYFPCSYNS